ncbi:uncharacterized protein LOC110973627 [Acanthaster planci]|uniref:Uncharacterized protein LOC110973627 n=1 Tax=Acanthaster planci TaxID=133434 RepID=A0A8B7XJA8_ACAPL|nr:uncharacterized protein LOC110973627 [Acanthaster planci]
MAIRRTKLKPQPSHSRLGWLWQHLKMAEESVVVAETVVEISAEAETNCCVDIKEFNAFCDFHFPLVRTSSNSSKTIRRAKGEKIIQCLRGFDTADDKFKYWVRRKGLQLRQFPELGLQDVLCLPRKNTKTDGLNDAADGLFGAWRCVAFVEDFHSLLLKIHEDTLNHRGGYKTVLREVGKTYACLPRSAVQQFVNMCRVCGNAKLEPVQRDDSVGQFTGSSRSNRQRKKMKKLTSKPHPYSPSTMALAYRAVKEGGETIRGAARKYGLPESTIRSRLSKNNASKISGSVADPIFSLEEETHLVEHLNRMMDCGYSFGKTEVMDAANKYALSLSKRDSDHPLSNRWFGSFVKRWPTLNVTSHHQRSLDSRRVKASSREAVSKYYTGLAQLLAVHGLEDTPERIFSLDEKSVKVYQADGGADWQLAVTIIGCGDALGCQIPPYFVFPGHRMRHQLLKGSTPGASGTVSDSGWSNTDIYKDYLLSHFRKYGQGGDKDKPCLILYDGHREHITLSLVDWAKDHHMILSILPAHMSHTLQPGDVSCFGPFEHLYSQECHRYMQENSCTGIDTESVCKLACETYAVALSPSNLQAFFKKAAIYPLNQPAIDKSFFPLNNNQSQTAAQVDSQQALDSSRSGQARSNLGMLTDDQLLNLFGQEPGMNSGLAQFVQIGDESPVKKLKTSKKRKCLCFLVSGKAITDEAILETLQDSASKKTSRSLKFISHMSKSKKVKKDAESNSTSLADQQETSGDQNLEDTYDASSSSDESDDLAKADSVVGILHILQ